ncbi:9861_t:CDS:2, partial [Entrophospora sp. SA101]
AEKEHEINRRTQGKAMQDVYRQQNEAKTKKIADEFAKQKKDEEEAKRRIREQIALDKAEPLEDVKTWIEEDRTDGKAPYNLIQNFPHRQFSINDETKSLKELNLCPRFSMIGTLLSYINPFYYFYSGNSQQQQRQFRNSNNERH